MLGGRSRGIATLAAVAGLACMAVLMVALFDNGSSSRFVLVDVDGPNALDNDKWEWYGVGADRDDGQRHLTRSGVIKNSWPHAYKDPKNFPTEREFRVVPFGAGQSMQLHDADAPNQADSKDRFYNAGAQRDDEYARMSTADKAMAAGMPKWSPNPTEFPIQPEFKPKLGQQMLAKRQFRVVPFGAGQSMQLHDADAPNQADSKDRFYNAGAQRDDEYARMSTADKAMAAGMPEWSPNPTEFPIRPEFRVVPFGASMQLHDADAPNQFDAKDRFYDAGAQRDDQFTRVPYAERVISGALPKWSPNPSEFPIKAEFKPMRGQQMLSKVEVPEEGMRVFRGTGETMVIEPGARAGQTLPDEGVEVGWAVPVGQWNPGMASF